MKTENKLIAQDFYFYNNGITYLTTSFKDHYTGQYYTDLEYCCRAIRVFGTQAEIDNAVNEYCKNFDLTIDECYDYKEEAEGAFWYESQSKNKEVREKLEVFTKMYNEKGKVLILRIQ